MEFERRRGRMARSVSYTHLDVYKRQIHRMTVNETIIFGTLEKCAHRHIGLTDGRTSVVALHGVQDHLAVHGLDISQQHGTDKRLNIMFVAFTIIPKRIRSTVANDILQPAVEPCIDRHIR